MPLTPWAIELDKVLKERDRNHSWLAREIPMDRIQFYRLRYSRPTSLGRRYRLNADLKKRICELLAKPGEGQRALGKRIFGGNHAKADV